MIQRNGDQLGARTERGIGKELGQPLVCTKMWSSQGIEVVWEEGPLQTCFCRTKTNPGKTGKEDRENNKNCLPMSQPRVATGIPGESVSVGQY